MTRDEQTMTRDEQTTKPRIKYAPPMLLKLKHPSTKALCSTGSSDVFCAVGPGASACGSGGGGSPP